MLLYLPQRCWPTPTALTEADFRSFKNTGLHYHPTYRYCKMLSSSPVKLFLYVLMLFSIFVFINVMDPQPHESDYCPGPDSGPQKGLHIWIRL
jgi:hypothetical protein